jgi:hypothetical protein
VVLSGNFEAVLDACVLLPPTLCDLFLKLAESPRLYLPRWSEEILDEVRRNHIEKFGFTEELADYWRHEVTRSFLEAMVSGYESFIDQCSNNDKDRHVLAAAIRCEADSVVAFNLRHFPKESLDPWGMNVSGASQFLTAMYEMQPAVVIAKLDDMGTHRRKDRSEVLAVLNKTVPAFSARIASDLGL